MVAGWKGLPVVAALVLVGAVSFTLVAAYQWAGRLGIFGEAATLAAGNWQGHVWKHRTRHHPLAETTGSFVSRIDNNGPDFAFTRNPPHAAHPPTEAVVERIRPPS